MHPILKESNDGKSLRRMEKSKLAFDCSINEAASNITWEFFKIDPKDGVQKSVEANPRITIENGTMTFLSLSDDDEGEYLCTAENVYGKNRARITLKLISKSIKAVRLNVQFVAKNV